MDQEFSVKGRIQFIDPEKQATEKFKVRTFGIDASAPINGMVYSNYIGFQVTQTKCSMLDELVINDEVVVYFAPSGQIKTKEELAATEKNPRKEVIFTNLVAYRIDLIKKFVPTEAPQQTAQTAQQTAQSDINKQPTPQGVDDLPF